MLFLEEESHCTTTTARDDFEPRRTPLLEFWHVGNDTDETPAALQVDQGTKGEVKRFGIETAKTFVHKERLQGDASSVGLNDITQVVMKWTRPCADRLQ